MKHVDIIIIGGGIAGTSTGFELAKKSSIAILEKEDHAGYHATGRSAALFAESYGSENTALYALIHASWGFFKKPPEGFSDYTLHHHRGVLYAAEQQNIDALRRYYEEMKARNPDAKWVDNDFIQAKFPPLKDNYTHAAIYDPNVYDLDVNALQEGYLKSIRQSGSIFETGFQVSQIDRKNDLWIVSDGEREYAAPCLVNAAGAWVDDIAEKAGVGKIGIQPLRRSAILVDGPQGQVSDDWPMLVEFNEEFYFKPEAGKLLVSPANEDLCEPCDVQADELDIAYAVHYAEQAMNLSVDKVNHSWAGLRSFVEDRSPVIGFDSNAEGFFWIAGQGGYGIQTAPAAARLAASLIAGEGVPQDMATLGLEESLVSPARLSATHRT